MKNSILKNQYVILCVILFLILVLFNFKSCASPVSDSELVILIDTSGTMEKSWTDVMRWANEIGAYARNTGTLVHLIGFGDSINSVYDGTVGSDYIENVRSLKADADWTDQARAMEEAVNILNGSTISRKCIVMLSDGRLDYKNDMEEADGKKRFKDSISEFLNTPGQSVVLIQFGCGEDDVKPSETYVFDNLDTGVQFVLSDKLNDENFSDKQLLDDSLPIIFDDLGIDYKTEPIIIQGDPFELRLEKDCYQIILELELLDGRLSEEMLERIWIEKKGIKMETDLPLKAGNVCFLYLENLSAGSYDVFLPEGKWNAHYVNLEKAEIQDIQLSVEQNGAAIVPTSEGCYELCADMETNLKIDIQVSSAEQISALEDAVIKCILLTENGRREESAVDVKNTNMNGTFYHSLKMENNEQYQCYIEIRQGENTYRSDDINIKTLELEDGDDTSGDVVVKEGEAINIREILNIPDDIKGGYIFINDKKKYELDKDGTDDGDDDSEYTNGFLYFRRPDTYEIKWLTENMERKCCCKVEKITCIEKILYFLKKIFNL